MVNFLIVAVQMAGESVGGHIPHAGNLVERAGGHVLRRRRHGHRGHNVGGAVLV